MNLSRRDTEKKELESMYIKILKKSFPAHENAHFVHDPSFSSFPDRMNVPSVPVPWGQTKDKITHLVYISVQ